ncbi:MAG: tetratricopeptide repeat protein, partial [Pyrinomonadaceae bacterium]|nr:tetratricopeptide repeat protein [Pyrinomonadaceae bacterium]
MARILTMLLLASALVLSASQAVGQSDEARRHFDRGMAAVELAKTPEDLNLAINEFKQATILAPDWPAAHFNPGKVLETAARYNEAIASYRKYLQVAPNASDADAVRSMINRIEMKAEQTLTVPAIIDVMVEFGRPQLWQYSATVRTSGRECRRAWGELGLAREGSDAVKAVRSIQYYTGPTGTTTTFQTLKVTGPVLR